jgi:putative endonuclease
MNYWVYIVQCRDGSFYTGYAVDVEKRIKAHNNSKVGAKYTKMRRPVELVYSESHPTKSEAMKREYQIKQLSRAEKELLIAKD